VVGLPQSYYNRGNPAEFRGYSHHTLFSAPEGVKAQREQRAQRFVKRKIKKKFLTNKTLVLVVVFVV
jgi:hypothetical protein